MAKDYYHDLLIPELIRYAKLQTMNPEKLDEYGAAIFSIWYTQNPLGKPNRDNICNFDEPEEEPVICDKKSALEAYGSVRLGEKPKPQPKRRPPKLKGIRFTAHTHPDEPLEPSPDDLIVYDRITALHREKDKEESDIVNFIIDGYTCRKANK